MLFSESICENKLFLKLYKRGEFVACPFLTVYFFPNKMEINRVGITVGKKIGKAVARNRAKRIIKAAYRLNEVKFPIGYDIVFVAREKIVDLKSDDIEEFINKRVLKRIGNPDKKVNGKKYEKSYRKN